MSIGNISLHQMGLSKMFKSFSMFSAVIACGILLPSYSSMAHPTAGTAPNFVNGATQSLSVCMSSTFNSLNTKLTVNDPDLGDVETWAIVAAPLHGTLNGFSITAASTGGTVTPTGLSYTPTAGYTGADSFSVQVNDGASSAFTTIVVNVKPIPSLSSDLRPAGICGNSVFHYTPTSISSGATFSWSRAFVPGITNAAASGTGDPAETLVNATYYTLAVTYVYTTYAGGCSRSQNVVVDVTPAPSLSSALADTACNGSAYTYAPTSSTGGVTYSWKRAPVAGVTPDSSNGTGGINEVLTSSLTTPANVVYSYSLNANGCTSVQNLTVTIVNQAPLATISTNAPSTVCNGTQFQNFGASIAPPAGVSYTWSAINADIYSVGSSQQFCLVNFNHSGDAYVTLSIRGAGNQCKGGNTYKVTVGTGSNSSANILYYNDQFIYLDNTQEKYQWGYDDAATLDSNIIEGATFQSYPTSTPDLIHHYYWVMTTKQGCTQKTYFNGPLHVINAPVQTADGIVVYPNPATGVLNADLSVMQGATAQLTIMDMMGRKLMTKESNEKTVRFDITELPNGCYMFNCYRNGQRVSTTRFIKN